MSDASTRVDPDWGPSAHLTWSELACHDAECTPYPTRFRQTRARRLAAVFEALRRACGDRPIRVLSAYRTPDHNRRVGGSRRSQHVEGRALDLAPPRGWTVAQFHDVVRWLACTDRRLGGFGYYPAWGVHIDIRPRPARGRLAVWNGRRADVRA